MPYERQHSRIRFTHESASATVQMDSGGVGFLMDVYSHEKRQGHATGLLREIIEWADDTSVILELVPMTYGIGASKSGLNDTQLIDFYKKFGFILEPNIIPYMHRPSIS